jgi:uncharacterized protein (TIGR02145 family)
MVLNILKILGILAILVQTFSCYSLELDNPNDPQNKRSNSSGETSSSSSSVAPNSSAASQSSSSSIRSSSSATPSSSSYVPVGLCDPETVVKSTFTDDRDRIEYKAVKICSQTWMAENLNYADGGVCYDNDPSNCAIYGRLYDWATALTVCPDGWHLPSDDEWQILVDFCGSSAGKKLKAASGWYDDLGSSFCNGTDDFGFAALPGGGLNSFDFGVRGYWWSSTEENPDIATYRYMGCHDGVDKWFNNYGYKNFLFSVRCVKNNE